PRYRMSADEIVKSAWKGYNHDIKMILLQTGEDPLFLDYMIPAIKRIKSEMPDAEIICCNGERTEKEYQALKDAGADKYILKFETSNPELYKKYRPHSTLEKRLNCAHLIKKVGLGLGTGFIIGLPGQTDEDIANDILMIKNLQPTPMASACPFIPNKGTELENEKAGDLFYSFKVVGISRLINPSVCMPACSPYEYLKKGGQIDGTGIGCTSVTIRLTPDKYRDLYQLYTNDRITINLDMAKEVVEAAHANWENF
ncbi:MAG TPA: radical SAM protein, partial [Candidatus Pacearchaeota archaeon]|nr:radical SAM protein [Candidatus Pacearchaeota archaeon]